MTGTVLNMPHGMAGRALSHSTSTVSITQEPITSKGWVDDILNASNVHYKLDVYQGSIKTAVVVENVEDVEVVLQWLRQKGDIRVWNNTNVRDIDFGLDTDEVIEKT